MFRLSNYAAMIGSCFMFSAAASAIPGPSISYGANPVVSAGGEASSSQTLFTAPSSQLIVVTDVVLTVSGYSNYDPCRSVISLITSGGDTIGSFRLVAMDDSGNNSYPRWGTSNVVHSFVSGLPLPIGESLELTHSGDCSVNYTISGYYAEP